MSSTNDSFPQRSFSMIFASSWKFSSLFSLCFTLIFITLQMISNPILVSAVQTNSQINKTGDNLLQIPCPEASVLRPCDCSNDSRIISCGPSVHSSSALPYPFRDAKQQINQNLQSLSESSISSLDPYLSISRDSIDNSLPFNITGEEWFDFEKLLIDGTSLERILPRTFESFVFHTLVIRNNYYLTNIEKDAFYPSENFIKISRFENNQKLGSTMESVEKLFEIIRTFQKLEQIIITNCGLNYLPPYSFGSKKFLSLPSLKRIILSHNKLTTVHPNSFAGLPSVRMIDLQYNLIRDIQSDSFRLMEPSQHCEKDHQFASHYKIDLRNNKIEGSGIDSESVYTSGCSVELNLSNNSIVGGLAEEHFRGLFINNIRIYMLGNDLQCTNCDNWWLLKSRECSNSGDYLKYYLLIETSSCSSSNFSFHRFVKCPQIARELEKKNQSHLLMIPPFELAYRLRTIIPDILVEKNSSLLICSFSGLSFSTHGSSNSSKVEFISYLFYFKQIFFIIFLTINFF